MRRTEAATDGPRRRRGSRLGIPAALLALAVGATACSSGGSSASTTTIDKAAAKTDISQAYSTLFNFTDKTVTGKIAVIQNGAALESSLNEALSSSLSSQATGSNVTTVTILSASTCSKDKLP
ncbi:MAG: hypothetical protein ACREOE_10805, partial [Gemmatimonadales bacterium]